MDKTFKHVLKRIEESDIKVPWYDHATATISDVHKHHAPISVNMVIKELKKENEKLKAERDILLKAVIFYAGDSHIRDYGNGQQVILESSEVEESDDGVMLPNNAGRALAKIKERE